MSVGQDNRWQKDAADQNFDYMFKLLIIGNSSVGKTSFLFRYADDSFTSAFVSTVGIDFKVKTVFRQDKRVKLQIWVRQTRASLSNNNTNKIILAFSRRKNINHHGHCFHNTHRTRQDKSDTEPSQRHTTAVLWASCWCTTLPMKNHSTVFKTGEFLTLYWCSPFFKYYYSCLKVYPNQDLFLG